MRRLALAFLVSTGLCASALAGPQAEAPARIAQAKGQATTAPKTKAANEAKPNAKDAGERIGDWTLLCPKTGEKAKEKDKEKLVECSIEQILADQDGQRVVFYLAVGGPRGNLIFAVRAPLGLTLAKGLEVSFGGQAVQRAPFVTCHARGCEAVLILWPALQAEMRQAERATVTIYRWNGGPFRAASSLKGFGDALDALNKRRGPS